MQPAHSRAANSAATAARDVRELDVRVIKRVTFAIEKCHLQAQSSPASSIDMWAGKSYAIVATCVTVRFMSLAAVLRCEAIRWLCLRLVVVAVRFSCQERDGLQ